MTAAAVQDEKFNKLEEKAAGDKLEKLRVTSVIFSPSSTTLEDSKSVLGEIAIGNSHMNLLNLPCCYEIHK